MRDLSRVHLGRAIPLTPAAGASGAAVYAIHCPELAAPFIAIWYVLGMALPVVAGALVGPRLLRW